MKKRAKPEPKLKKRKRMTIAQKFARALKEDPLTGLPRDLAPDEKDAQEPKQVRRIDFSKISTVLPEGYVFGRPTKYEPRFCDELTEWMSKGFSFESFSPSTGLVTDGTLRNWLEAYPDFLLAKQAGLKACRIWWEHAGTKGMESPTFKPAVWRMNMMNRFGWSEKTTTELDDKRDLAKKFEGMSDEDLRKAAGDDDAE